jgi:hypothetical protein
MANPRGERRQERRLSSTQQARAEAVSVPSSFREICSKSKKFVYSIVRLRDTPEGTRYLALGTGFVASPNRFVTCAHCINTSEPVNELQTHQDGDVYLLVQRDEDGLYFRFGLPLIENESLFAYPQIDMAVMYLPDEFYKDTDAGLRSRDDYLKFDLSVRNIGHDIGILGYPFPLIKWDEAEPDLDGVLIRADRGVLNTRYITEGVEIYEFTTSFHPGNSGGPIIDIETGRVIGVVHGYRQLSTHSVEDVIARGTHNNKEEIQLITMLKAIYSIGVSSRNLVEFCQLHGLLTA